MIDNKEIQAINNREVQAINNNGNTKWNEWSRHVLAELERLNKQVESIEKDLINLRVLSEGQYQSLLAKSGIFGVAGGAIVIIIPIILKLTGIM